MHIMKRGLNYLRRGRASNKDPSSPAPSNPQPQIQSVHVAVNSRWSPESDISVSSTGATLSSGDESQTSTTTDPENYFYFERHLNSHQPLQRMSTVKHCSGNLGSLPPNLPPPPPSPEFRSFSRATIPRCSSRNSLDFPMGDENRPSSSQTAPVFEELYAKVQKTRRPRKRVCFRDPLSLSAIEEVSPVAPTSDNVSNLENVVPRRLSVGFPTPSPFKSPAAKPLPKTNPHFTLPKSFGTQLKNRLEHSSSERVCSYYDSDDGSFSSYNSTSGEGSRVRKGRPGGASVGMQRVLAGLKSFGIKGELYVTILLNRGLVTITIDECRNLVPPCSSAANSYVRLSLMPDDEKRTHCRTSLIPRSNNPVFNQTFTIELLPEDYVKRLLISVWHRDLNTQKSSLLGCMAFTVKHLMHTGKEVDGWYFLLAPSFGRHKHLAVDKVNMLTYYGSVDSGLQASSGTSISSQEDQSVPGAHGKKDIKRQVRRRPPPPALFLAPPNPYDGYTDTSESSVSAMTSTSAANSAATTSSATSTSTAASTARQFFGQIRAISPLRNVASAKDTQKTSSSAKTRKSSVPAAPSETENPGLGVPAPVTFTVSTNSSPQDSLPLTPVEDNAQINPVMGEEYLTLCEALDDSVILSQNNEKKDVDSSDMRRTRSFDGNRANPLKQRNSSREPSCEKSEHGENEHQTGMKKKLSFAGPIAKKLSFFRRRPATDTTITAADVGKPSRIEVERWATSFDILLRNTHGLQLFRLFLQREFSEENIDFWIACEEFKKIKVAKMPARAKQIYAEFVQVQAPKEVNLDSTTRTSTEEWVNSNQPLHQAFDHAQHRIQSLMEKDSYPRFLKSDLYVDLINSIKK